MCKSTFENAMPDIKLVCHNVNGLGSSKPYVYKLISEFDIVGISEHWLSGPELNQLDVIANHMNVSCIYKCNKMLSDAPPERGRGYGGVALFCSNKLVSSPISGISSDRIIGLKVQISNEWLSVFNVYLPSSKVNNGSEFHAVLDELESLLLEYSANSKIIVMGDFNCHIGDRGGPRGEGQCSTYGSRLLNVLNNEYIQCICCDMSYNALGPKYTFDKPGIGRSWIDHIFVSQDLYNNVANCYVLDDELLNVSDHLPVAMYINVLNVPTTTINDNGKSHKILWHKLTQTDICIKYTDKTNVAFEGLMNIVTTLTDEGDVNTATRIISDKLVAIAADSFSKKGHKRRSNAKPFWSSQLSILSKNKKVAYNAWVAAGRPNDPNNHLFQIHKASKQLFRKSFRQAEAIFKSGIEECIESCSELDQRQFWYLLKRDQRVRKNGNILKTVNNVIVAESDKVCDMWKKHFENLGKHSVNVNYDDDFAEFVKNKIKLFNASNEEMSELVLDKPITADEVESICTKFKLGKSQDFSGLSQEHLRYAGKTVYCILSMLFNAINKYEKLPKEFLKGVAIPLFKGGNKDPLNQDDYRGITIQNILCKLYDNIIMNRSADVIKMKVSICETQCACEKGLSSINASLLLQESIAHNVENNKDVYVVFFDTRKAFDTVWVDGLFYLLYCHGIKGKLWRLLRNAYVNSICSVFVNGQLSAWFKLFQGVKQGAVMSMLLYICFINMTMKSIIDLNTGCTTMGLNTCCIGYADDIAVMALRHVDAQRMVNLASKMCNKWRFEFSVKKCALMIYSKKSVHKPISLGNCDLPIVNEYNHVGVMTRSKGKIRMDDIKSNIASSKRALYSVIGGSIHRCGLSPLTMSKVYWSVSIPKLLAGAEVKQFSDTELAEYEKFHCQMAKDIQNIPQTAPNISALATLGWLPLSYYIDYLRLMFILRLMQLAPGSVHWQIVVRRMFYILANGIYSNNSPIASCIKACYKYNLSDEVLQWLDSGYIPSKDAWKNEVKKRVCEKYHSIWRFELNLYPKLCIYRVIQIGVNPSCWWLLAKALPFLKCPCSTVIRLLCGSNILAVNTKCDIPREERVCDNCTLMVVEDITHFVMYCPKFIDIRQTLFHLIESTLSYDGKQMWKNLDDQLKCYIILGLQFPFNCNDSFLLNYFSCIMLHKMYMKRRALQVS